MPAGRQGFTLVEMLVAMTIFIMVASVAVIAFAQIIRSQGLINERRKLQDETQFILEKIVKEFRNGTIDYPQYFSDHWDPATYGQYQSLPPTSDHPPSIRNGTDIAPPVSDPTCARNCEETLNLVNPDGTLQTIIQRNSVDLTVEVQERFADCLDGDDVRWTITDEYNDGFLPLSANSIKVTDLQFFIAPLNDPNKVYEDDAMQLQPSVVIRMTAETKKSGFTLDVETTVASRVYDEVTWDTNLADCL